MSDTQSDQPTSVLRGRINALSFQETHPNFDLLDSSITMSPSLIVGSRPSGLIRENSGSFLRTPRCSSGFGTRFTCMHGQQSKLIMLPKEGGTLKILDKTVNQDLAVVAGDIQCKPRFRIRDQLRRSVAEACTES